MKDVDGKCWMTNDLPNSIAHKFWESMVTQRVWDFSIGIINATNARPNKNACGSN